MNKKMTIAAGILWLAGLAVFIIGLNVPGDTGKWLSTGGQIAFLVGLALEGVVIARRPKTEIVEDKPDTGSKAGDPQTADPETGNQETDSQEINGQETNDQ